MGVDVIHRHTQQKAQTKQGNTCTKGDGSGKVRAIQRKKERRKKERKKEKEEERRRRKKKRRKKKRIT